MRQNLSFSNCNFFTVLYYNARSLFPKFDVLLFSIETYHPHIICIVETWLGNEITSSEIEIQGYQLYRRDRNRHGGGILIYVAEYLLVSVFPDPPPQLELLALSVRLNNFRINLCLFYRPPSSGSHIFDSLVSYLDSICAGSLSNFIFLGDFNVNFTDRFHPYHATLESIMSLYCLSQHVSDPTHIHHSGSDSTIDLLFTSEDSQLHTCETVPPLANSDHYGILSVFNKKVNKRRTKNKGRRIWRYSYADWDGANEAIEQFDWTTVMTQNIDDTWENWLHQFMSIMNQFIPNCTLLSKRNLPWLTKPLINSIKKRNLLFKRAKKSASFRNYKIARNKTLADIRSAKLAYSRKLNPKDPKKFWKAVKFLNKKQKSIPTLTLGDTTASTDREKANLLNSFFHSCFNTSHLPISSPAESSIVSPIEFLCTEEEVFDLLVSLDVSKANGPDGISARMLKFTAASITPSVTKLFNHSISRAQLPTQWKKSAIVAIPKTSDTSTPANYRPISLLPLLSKLLERHFHGLIIQHLQLHQILSDLQWGFLEGRSTVTALIKCTDDWLKTLEDGGEVCTVFFDYRKAFDSVPHRPLIIKLRSLGLDDCIIRWLKSYLSNRMQVVVVDGVESDPLPVLSGVPQGSVLGPLLFLLYINDLPDVVSNTLSRLNLFADDVLLYRTIACAADYASLQEVISRIEQWSTENYLSFNTSKCKFMVISRKINPTLPDAPLQLFGTSLDQVDSYKYLGVLLTGNLSWSLQVESVCARARRVLGLLYRRFYGLASRESLKQLYLSHVRPHLEYACQVWDPHLARDKGALEKVQKFACKLATSKWDSSYEELLRLVDVQPLQDRRLELKLGILFKLVHNLCFFPEGSWSYHPNCRNSRNSHSLQLSRPLAHTNSYMYSFFPHTVSNWNMLDNKTVTCTSYKSFISNL